MSWEREQRTKAVCARFGWTSYLGNRLTIAQQRDVLRYVREMERQVADLESAIQRLLTNPVTKCYTGGLL